MRLRQHWARFWQPKAGQAATENVVERYRRIRSKTTRRGTRKHKRDMRARKSERRREAKVRQHNRKQHRGQRR